MTSSSPFTLVKKFQQVIFLFFLLFIFLFSTKLYIYGQEDEKLPVLSPSALNLHKWGAITLFHGLPSNHVRAIAQDLDGILWFGTDSGLARYDGRRTEKIVNSNLPSEKVSVLTLTTNGELWIGTDLGAVRLINNEFQPILPTANYSITSIINPKPDQVILTSLEGVIFICSLNGAKTEVKTIGPKDNPLLEIAKDSPLPITSAIFLDNSLIVSTRGRGLLKITDRDIKEIPLRPRSFFIEKVAKNKNGSIFLATQTGKEDSGLLETSNLSIAQKLTAITGTVSDISISPDEDIWIGTNQKGVFHFRDGREVEKFSFENSGGGLQSNQVYSIFIDREKVMWFGTDRGVCRYDPNSPHGEKITDQAQNNFIRIFYKTANGQLWSGSNAGLFTREVKNIGWQQILPLGNRAIHSVYEWESNLFIGTSNGLFISQLDKEGKYKEFAQLSENFVDINDTNVATERIRAICQFKNKIYLANFEKGLEVLENNQRKLIWPLDKQMSKEKEIISLSADQDKLWIGTTNAGLFSFDGQTVTPINLNLTSNPIRAILSEDNQLWIGTDNGLYQYKNNQLNLVIKDIEVWALYTGQNNSLWCATRGKGLFKITNTDWNGITYSRFGNEHGIPSDSVFSVFSELIDKEETIWIGTNRGVAQYKPGTTPPILRLTRILGSQIYALDSISRGLNLDYPQNSLVIDVAAISSRTFSEQFQYLFLLFDGKEKLLKQKLSKDSQFLTENLSPGTYKIEIRAYSNTLIDSKPVTLYFTVAQSPFPWTTLSLSILLILALLALWWGYHQNIKLFSTNKALANANQQLAETRLQLASETENERQRIARDLHDQTLSDLRQLLMMTDQLPKESIDKKRSYSNIFRGEIESISTEIRRICEDLSPSVLTNVGLTAALEWSLTEAVAHLPKEKKFEYQFNCSDDLEDKLTFDAATQIQIYRILQEAISNICRHAQAKNVSITIDITKDNLFIVTLTDDGCGFKVGTKTGRGLSNISSRASLIDAEVSWQANPPQGTLFTLKKQN